MVRVALAKASVERRDSIPGSNEPLQMAIMNNDHLSATITKKGAMAIGN